MFNKLAKINRVSAIITILVSITFTFYADTTQAKVFDWFLGNSNGNTSGAVQNIASAVYMDAIAPATSISDETQPIVVQNNFIGSMSHTVPIMKIVAGITPAINRQFMKNQSNLSGNGPEYIVSATGYSSTPDQTDSTPFITANGSHVHDGTLAANFLPFGTKVRIPDYFGDKIFVVEDRMAQRFSTRIDIWYPDRATAMDWGLRTVKIQVVEK